MKNAIFIISILLLIILMSSKPALCQDNSTMDRSNSLSKVFSQITFGLGEMYSLVVGYNIDKYNSIGIKYSRIWIAHDNFSIIPLPLNGVAIGIKYSYSFYDEFFIRNIHITASTIYSVGIDKASFSVDTFNKGFLLECTTGNKINYNKGFSFMYELGFLATQLKERKLLFWPSLKIGTNFNF